MDVNGDGIKDIISGDYVAPSKGKEGIAFQYVFKGLPEGGFGEVEVLKNREGQPITLPGINGEDRYDRSSICTHPFACDWDGDGNLDLVIGNFEGGFFLLKGEGTEGATETAFAASGTFLQDENGNPLKCDYHGAPFVVDWDGDGDLELLSGTARGGAVWSENVGTREDPKMKTFERLIDQASPQMPGAETTEPSPSANTRLWVDDLNGDGKFDILLGDQFSFEYRKPGLSDEEFAKLKSAWEEKDKEVSSVINPLMEKFQKGELSQEEVQSRMEKHQEAMMENYQLRSQFMQNESSGYVWLYLGK